MGLVGMEPLLAGCLGSSCSSRRRRRRRRRRRKRGGGREEEGERRRRRERGSYYSMGVPDEVERHLLEFLLSAGHPLQGAQTVLVASPVVVPGLEESGAVCSATSSPRPPWAWSPRSRWPGPGWPGGPWSPGPPSGRCGRPGRRWRTPSRLPWGFACTCPPPARRGPPQARSRGRARGCLGARVAGRVSLHL